MKEKEHNSYIGSLIHGITSLLTGMKTTMTVFWRKKTTEQYPENRKTLKLSERFRGTLTMPHNEKNEHHCVACGLCQTACPNDTIKVTSQTIETEDGKKKKILAKYEYDLGSCIFDRSKLVLTLNHPGSHVEEKKKPAAPQPEAAK